MPGPAEGVRSETDRAAPVVGARASDQRRLLDWYEPRRHAYPWRTGSPDPYQVLVSEVMLQQTQAPRVVPIFEAFVARFPDVASLAAATRADVVRAWAGLGYHRRAVSLHAAAWTIGSRHGGAVPADAEELRALPGVGPYTASAVASIAYGVAVAAVDTNVRRVAARYFFGREPNEVVGRDLDRGATAWVDRSRPGDWNQALMDLGRGVCRPRPSCDVCPLHACRTRLAGDAGGSAVGAGGTAGRVRAHARRQQPFEGSNRQTRGRVLAAVRDTDAVAMTSLVERTGVGARRVRAAVAGLERDGLVVRERGLVRLAT